MERVKEDRRAYFKRLVLAAEIVAQLHEQDTFGRVKCQSLVYLCGYVAGLPPAPGNPFHPGWMFGAIGQMEKKGWFSGSEEEVGKFRRMRFMALDRGSDYRAYYVRYFSGVDPRIQRVISFFGDVETRWVDLVARVHEGMVNRPDVWRSEEWVKKFTEEEVSRVEDWIMQEGWI